MDDEVKITLPGARTSDEVTITEPESGVRRAEKIARRGLYEAVPFVGERMAEKAELPMPESFGEKLSRRAFRNLPYAGPAIAVNPLLGTVGLAGATALGQAAEELGLPEGYQAVGEMIGGAVPSVARTIAGKTMGYIEPQLEELYKKGKSVFELGPGARSAAGMKYGAGETQEEAIRNLNKFTEMATSVAGNATKNVDGKWIKNTKEILSKEADNIFSGKTFASDPNFLNEVTDLAFRAEGAFGQQGNVVKTILEKNIGGKRPGGGLVEPTFKAEDLRSAIVEVNERLGSATGNEAGLLYKLKDSLENLAKENLRQYGGNLAQRYETWRKNYHAFSTIKDVFRREGSSGVTAAGQLNPKTLKDVIDVRTNSNPTINPLFSGLAEFGDIMRAKTPTRQGLTAATLQVLPETSLAKALKLGFQPRATGKMAERARALQAIGPAQRMTQISPEDVQIIEPERK